MRCEEDDARTNGRSNRSRRILSPTRIFAGNRVATILSCPVWPEDIKDKTTKPKVAPEASIRAKRTRRKKNIEMSKEPKSETQSSSKTGQVSLRCFAAKTAPVAGRYVLQLRAAAVSSFFRFPAH